MAQTDSAGDPATVSGGDPSMLVRRLVAGFLSGASGPILILLGIAALGIIGGLCPLIYFIATGVGGQVSFWQTIGASIGRGLASIPLVIWSARWGILALGVLGVLLALITTQARRLERPWRGVLGLVASLGIVGGLVFGLQYASRESLFNWIVDQASLYSDQGLFLISTTASLVIGLIVALPAAYLAWALWQWWYVRWAGWMRLPLVSLDEPAPPPEPAAAPVSDWLADQSRLYRSKRGVEEPDTTTAASAPAVSHRLLRIFAAGLAGITLILLGAFWLYNSVGSEVSGSSVYVTKQSPSDTAQLRFERPPQRMILSNIGGHGAVDIALGADPQAAPARQLTNVALANTANKYQSASMDLNGLAPGAYRLNVTLREGEGGQVRYVVLEGGGAWGQVAAWLIGISAGIWLALAALVVLETLAVRGWRQSRAIHG